MKFLNFFSDFLLENLNLDDPIVKRFIGVLLFYYKDSADSPEVFQEHQNLRLLKSLVGKYPGELFKRSPYKLYRGLRFDDEVPDEVETGWLIKTQEHYDLSWTTDKSIAQDFLTGMHGVGVLLEYTPPTKEIVFDFSFAWKKIKNIDFKAAYAREFYLYFDEFNPENFIWLDEGKDTESEVLIYSPVGTKYKIIEVK